jgi:hypothetical protein
METFVMYSTKFPVVCNILIAISIPVPAGKVTGVQ